jgi:hypothetical protein
MDPQIQKVLRRICAQFHTGIRKPFDMHGKTYVLTISSAAVYLEADAGLAPWIELSEVTPEKIFEAIQLHLVAEVMES